MAIKFLNNVAVDSDVLYVDTVNNRVGIGTDNPLYKLQVQDRIHVVDTTNFQPKISFSENTNNSGEFVLEYNGVGGGAGNYVSFYSEVAGWVSKGNGLNYIPSNGRVGIGTANPGYTLDVSGTLHSSNITLADGIYHEGDTNTYINFLTDTIQMATSGSPRVYINSSGNVGIGTTGPIAKLHVLGSSSNDSTTKAEMLSNSAFSVRPHSSNSGTLAIAQVDSGNSVGMQFTNGSGTSNWDISMQPFGGNVGIGTTSPSQKLHVNGSAIFSPVGSTTPTLDLVSSNGSSDPFTRYYDESNGPSWCTGLDVSDEKYKISFDYDNTSISTSTKLTIDTAGKVGIGTTNPRSKLDVAGGVRIANDSAAASALNVGTLRYRTSGNNSYVDMCMQTGASTYAWVNIVQNNW